MKHVKILDLAHRQILPAARQTRGLRAARPEIVIAAAPTRLARR